MHKIFKYPLLLSSDFTGLALPKDAKILKVDAQFDQPCIWALIDTDAEIDKTRRFILIGTGWDIKIPLEKLSYIDTFQMGGGTFIWHVFERIY